jgi:hypothetical protein
MQRLRYSKDIVTRMETLLSERITRVQDMNTRAEHVAMPACESARTPSAAMTRPLFYSCMMRKCTTSDDLYLIGNRAIAIQQNRPRSGNLVLNMQWLR